MMQEDMGGGQGALFWDPVLFQGKKKILPREAKSVLDSSLPMHFHYCIQVTLKKNSKGKVAKPWVFVINAAK